MITGALWVFGSAVTYGIYYSGAGAILKHLSSLRRGLEGTSSSLILLILSMIVAGLSLLSQLPATVYINNALVAAVPTYLILTSVGDSTNGSDIECRFGQPRACTHNAGLLGYSRRYNPGVSDRRNGIGFVWGFTSKTGHA